MCPDGYTPPQPNTGGLKRLLEDEMIFKKYIYIYNLYDVFRFTDIFFYEGFEYIM